MTKAEKRLLKALIMAVIELLEWCGRSSSTVKKLEELAWDADIDPWNEEKGR